MNYQESHRRYLHDPVYHAMVDAMRKSLQELTLTPSEMREAVMLACIQFENERVRYGPSIEKLQDDWHRKHPA